MDVFANHRAYWKKGISVILMLAASVPASAQSDRQKTRVFTLEEAVDFALKNYPAVRASLERLRSAEAGVGLARTSYLPRTEVLWQSNRATDNNIAGLTLPNSVIAPITGPVPLATSNRSAWGSAGGLLFSWERGEGGRGARSSKPRFGGSVSDTPRCRHCHGERVPDAARGGADRPRGVFQQHDPDHYDLIANVPSGIGIRTGYYFTRRDRFYVRVPAKGSEPAQVWTYEAED